MPFITLNREKCKRDGICVQECPAQILAMADRNAFPAPIENTEEFCTNCGHCVAVCPHGALTLETMCPEDCSPLNRDLLPGPEAIRHFLMARRSIRQYKKTPVAHEILAELIDTARHAPTGSNKQQVYWTIFENPAEVQRLAAMVIDFIRLMIPMSTDEDMNKRMRRILAAWDKGHDRILRSAPHLVLVHAPADLPFAEADCVIALTYLELYAYARGLGTCWAGYFTATASLHTPLIEALNLPAGHRCFGTVMLGYPRFKYERIPQRNAAMATWR